ncbi:hypothetical protein V6N13_127582 [Hibiscus sabdariffa]
MVDSAGEWDWRILQDRLPQHILLRLAAMHRPQQSFHMDYVEWGLRDDRSSSNAAGCARKFEGHACSSSNVENFTHQFECHACSSSNAASFAHQFEWHVCSSGSGADALRLIEQRTKGGGPFTLVHQIHVLRELDWRLVFSKVGRGSNDVADRLAKLSSYASLDTKFFDDSPL